MGDFGGASVINGTAGGPAEHKSPGSTSDLISLRVNNKIGGVSEALSPSKRNAMSAMNDSTSIVNPTPIRTSKIVPTKTLNL